MGTTIADRFRWLLIIIKLSGYIEGSTRFQKLTFLVSKSVKELSEYKFYDDWVASKFGPYSKDVATDIGHGIEFSVIKKSSIKNGAGYLVDCFTLTDEGTQIADQMADTNPKVRDKIDEVIKPYVKAPLMSLLHDVYYQYPQYASGSTIKAEVARSGGYTDTQLNRQYD